MRELNWKNYTIANILFFGMLLIMFREFFFNFETLLVTSDHLNSLGMRFIRDGLFLTQWDPSKLGGIPTLDATFGDAYHPLVFLQSMSETVIKLENISKQYGLSTVGTQSLRGDLKRWWDKMQRTPFCLTLIIS